MPYTHVGHAAPSSRRLRGLIVRFDHGTQRWPVLAIGERSFVVEGAPVTVDTPVHVTFILSSLLSVTVTARAHGIVEQAAQVFSVDSEFAEVAALLELAAADEPVTIH